MMALRLIYIFDENPTFFHISKSHFFCKSSSPFKSKQTLHNARPDMSQTPRIVIFVVVVVIAAFSYF